MNSNIIFAPTEEHLQQLKAWLEAEYAEQGEGFFVNWDYIVRSFRNNEIYCLTVDGTAMAFLVWAKYAHDRSVQLEICAVHPAYRRQGLGRQLMEASLAKFKAEKYRFAELECMPKDSEPVWRSMGFKLVSLAPWDTRILMRRTLTPARKPRQNSARG